MAAQPQALAMPVLTCRFGPLRGMLVASRRLPYLYVQNWKCGCSTIKNSLWQAEHALGLAVSPAYPHDADGPFVHDAKRWEHCDREFVFTFVRNPFVRALSAYLNQIVMHRDDKHWGKFAAQHRLGDGPLEFREFLKLIAGAPHDGMDPHWRPQYCSVEPALIPYDFIGTVETFDRDLGMVLERIFGRSGLVSAYAPHRTDAYSKLAQHYGPVEVDLVRTIYAQDFALLDYDTDPAKLERRHGQRPSDPVPISRWGQAVRLVEDRNFTAAIQVLRPLRSRLAGPNVDDLLLRSYRAALGDPASPIAPADVAALEDLTRDRPDDFLPWKLYGLALGRCGRREESLAAQVYALHLRPPDAKRRRQLRRLGWQLAMTRARRGRTADAIATLRALPAHNGGGLGARVDSTVRRGWLRLVGATVGLIGGPGR